MDTLLRHLQVGGAQHVNRAFPPSVIKTISQLPEIMPAGTPFEDVPVYISWHSANTGWTWHITSGRPTKEHGYLFFGYIEGGFNPDYGHIPASDLVLMRATPIKTRPYFLRDYFSNIITNDMIGQKIRTVNPSGKREILYVKAGVDGSPTVTTLRKSRFGSCPDPHYRSLTILPNHGYSTKEPGPHGTNIRIAAACKAIVAGRTGTRSFDDCFEMGDSDHVFSGMIRRAKKNPKLLNAMLAFWKHSDNYQRISSETSSGNE